MCIYIYIIPIGSRIVFQPSFFVRGRAVKLRGRVFGPVKKISTKTPTYPWSILQESLKTPNYSGIPKHKLFFGWGSSRVCSFRGMLDKFSPQPILRTSVDGPLVHQPMRSNPGQILAYLEDHPMTCKWLITIKIVEVVP